eukprot:TRINITY_DN32419_c0_g1_i1.p1 TRINITY_DN32419_c0_g1~~TRINITY_DN32419_c0_g1_i1.p1  ORF type:complete len:485 (-),score=154.17 TRINITY_DN32419_c0_g1_i1:42-1304(-)
MGDRKDSKSSIAINVDADGEINRELIVTRGGQKRDNQTIFVSSKALVEHRASKNELIRPDEEETNKDLDDTRDILTRLVNNKVASTQAIATAKKTAEKKPATLINYTPSVNTTGYTEGASRRLVKMKTMGVDPLEPPKFRHSKAPSMPPEAPAPVLHSPTRKMTKEEKAAWVIPPSISNWKNSKGYTIPLDKRMAADGRGLLETSINDNFAKFSEALFIAERKAREEVEKRAQLQKTLQQKEREREEEKFREMAAQARLERVTVDPNDPEAVKREEIRRERRKEHERELRMENRGSEAKRQRTQRERERDVSEKIALGLAAPKSGEVQYDQRLFNQTSGMDTGHGDDEDYNLYSKPLFNRAQAAQIYNPARNKETGETYEDLKRGPVEFEKGGNIEAGDEGDEADPFGLEGLIQASKKGE